MENCFKKQLKRSVDNNALPKYEHIRLKKTVSNRIDVVEFSLNVTPPFTIYITGDGHFTDSTGSSDLGQSLTFSRKYDTLYLSDGEYYLNIPAKYNIDYLRINNDKLEVDIEELKYTDGITELQAVRTLLYGDITPVTWGSINKIFLLGTSLYGDFSNIVTNGTSIVDFQLSENIYISGDAFAKLAAHSNLRDIDIVKENSVSGNIAQIGSTNFRTLGVRTNQPGITGTIESLVANKRLAGKTSGTMYIGDRGYLPNITYNATSIKDLPGSTTNATVTWDANDITVTC